MAPLLPKANGFSSTPRRPWASLSLESIRSSRSPGTIARCTKSSVCLRTVRPYTCSSTMQGSGRSHRMLMVELMVGPMFQTQRPRRPKLLLRLTFGMVLLGCRTRRSRCGTRLQPSGRRQKQLHRPLPLHRCRKANENRSSRAVEPHRRLMLQRQYGMRHHKQRRSSFRRRCRPSAACTGRPIGSRPSDASSIGFLCPRAWLARACPFTLASSAVCCRTECGMSF
mmetsp:Transcript_54904/g.178381  ORF Transcript_54904/g.178381 Transcript_54904/m.178381 type:complete len:225 (-) Transcript_54904:3360-4034(-)